MKKDKKTVQKSSYSKGKRLIAILLATSLVLPMLPKPISKVEAATATDAYGFSMPMKKLTDKKHPYGNDNNKVVLNPISELFAFQSSTSGYSVAAYNDMKTTKDNLNGSKKEVLASSSKMQDMCFPVAVAFDGTGSGRKHMAAVTGLRGKSVCIDVYDSTKKGSEKTSKAISMGGGNNSDWYGSISQYEYRNYFSITAGDFDGDGKDELAVYLMFRSNPCVQIYDVDAKGILTKKGKDIHFDGIIDYPNIASQFTYDSWTKRAMLQCSLDAADLDRDGKDELVAAVSFADIYDDCDGDDVKDRTTGVAIYKLQGDDMVTGENHYRITDGSKRYMRTAAVTTGDIDFDGFPEVVVGGYYADAKSEDDVYSSKLMLATIQYDHGTKTYRVGDYQDVKMNAFTKDGFYGSDYVLPQPALCCVAVDGRNFKEQVFLCGTFYSYNNGTWKEEHTQDIYTKGDDGIGGNIISNIWVEDAVAANFDGNELGIEQVYSTSCYKQNSCNSWWYTLNLAGKQMKQNPDKTYSSGAWYDSKWQHLHSKKSGGTNNNLAFTMAAVDCDDDSDLIQFKKKEYTYSDVDVLAILEAAPYFEDLVDGYADTSGFTSFGIGEGEGGSTSNIQSTSAGIYANFHAGTALARFTTEASFMHEWEWEYEEEQSIEYNIDFTGGYQEHTVVLFRTPLILYTYDVYKPGDKKPSTTMQIGIPEDPVYSTMGLEEYNKIAETDPKSKIIPNTAISSIPGQPTTYHTDKDFLPEFVGYKTFVTSNSSSTAITGQSITTSQGTTSSQSYTNSIELQVGVELGGDEIGGGAGVSRGSGWGKGQSTVDYSSVTKSGEVPSQPQTDSPYAFDWKFGTWSVTIGENEKEKQVPVLGYRIKNVIAPPSKPKEFTVNDTTTNSVTLSWEHGPVQPKNYLLYQYFEDSVSDDGYVKVAEIDGRTNTFCYENLSPGKAYTFAMRSEGIDPNTGEVVMTDLTDPIKAYTLKGGAAPTVQSVSGDQKVCMGDTAVFSVNAFPSSEANGAGLNYNWQVKSANGSTWERVNAFNGSTLKLNNVTKEMNGNNYRCELVELSNGERNNCYSPSMKLSVGKGVSTTTVTALNGDKNCGKADYTEANVSIYEEEITKVVDITIGEATESYIVYEIEKENESDVTQYIYLSQADNTFYLLEDYLNMYPEEGATATERIALSKAKPYIEGEVDGKVVHFDPEDMQGTPAEYIKEVIMENTPDNPDDDTVERTIYNTYIASKGTIEDGTLETLIVYEKDGEYYTLSDENQLDEWTNTEGYSLVRKYNAEGISEYNEYFASKKDEKGDVEFFELYENEGTYYRLEGTNMVKWEKNDEYTLELKCKTIRTAEKVTDNVSDSFDIYEIQGIYYELNDKNVMVQWQNTEGHTITPKYVDEDVINIEKQSSVILRWNVGIKENDQVTELPVYIISIRVIDENKEKEKHIYCVKNSEDEFVPLELKNSDDLCSNDGTYNMKTKDFPVKETVEREQVICNVKDGDPVNLTATVKSASKGKSVNGTVTFVILNNRTGEQTTINKIIGEKTVVADSKTEAGTTEAGTTEAGTTEAGTTETEQKTETIIEEVFDEAVVTEVWKPSTGGDYTIRATFSGNDFLDMSYGTTSFYAEGDSQKTDYVLTAPDRVCYGETIRLVPKMLKPETDGNLATEDLPEGTLVNYKVGYIKDNNVVTDTVSNEYYPKSPGTYTFKATIDDSSATKTVNVTKRPITIAAPVKRAIPSDAGEDKVPKISDVLISYTGDAEKPAILETDYTLEDIFYYETAPTADSVAGEYEIKLALKKNDQDEYTDIVKDFLSKYDITFITGYYGIVDDGHTVNIEAGSNGSFRAFEGDDKKVFSAGSVITHGEKLSVNAVPNADFKLGKWEVKDAAGNLLVENVDYTITAGNYLTVDKVTTSLNIKVNFVPITQNVSFSAGENGAVMAKYLVDGNEGNITLNSPEQVQSGKSIRLTATPKDGFIVKQWLISKNGNTVQPKLNADGSIYCGTTLDLTEIRDDYGIQVEFEELAFYDVVTGVVSEDLGSAAGNNIEVIGLNANGKAERGSTITFKAKLTESSMVSEWRLYEEGQTTYKVVASNTTTYVLNNIKGNVRVEMCVSGSKKYQLHFKAVDEKGVEVPDVLSAKSGEEILKTDVAYTALIPVDIYAELPDEYQVEGWTLKTALDGETEIAEPNKTLSIESLKSETTVTLHLLKRPSLTYAALDENGTIFCSEVENGKYVDKLRTEPIMLTLSPNYGYEVDGIEVTGAEYELVPSKENTDVTLKLQKDGGFTEDMTVNVSYKALPATIHVTYDMHDLGDGVHGNIKAVADRMGNAEYKRTAEGTIGTLQDVYRDSVVTFTAAPEAGYIVSKWYVNGKEVTSGISSNASAKDTFTIVIDETHTSDIRVTAQMGQSGNRINYGANADGIGSVTAYNKRTNNVFYSGNSVAENTDVEFTAKAAAGYELTGWTVDGRVVEGATDTTYTYRATGMMNVDVRAVFERVRYNFALVDTNGTIRATTKVGENEESLKNGDQPRGGTEITVSAEANPGWRFTSWDITGVELTEEVKENNPLTFTTNGEISVKAVYGKESNCTVQYFVATPEGGSLEASVNNTAFESGSLAAAEDKIVFKALPNENYKVVKWIVDGVSIDTNEATYTLEVSKAVHNVSVNYGLITSKITFESNDTTMGTVEAKNENVNLQSGSAVKVYGKVSFIAKPATGYMVEGWYSDKDFTSRVEGTGAEQLSFEKASVYGDCEVYVKFVKIPEYTVNVLVNGTGVGNVTVKVNDKVVSIPDGRLTAPLHSRITVEATPYNKYNYLEKWNGVNADNLIYVVKDLAKDETITATFSPAELVDVSLNVPAGIEATVSAGYENDRTDIAAVGKEVQIINGQNVAFEVVVPEGKMIDKWRITYKDGSVKEGRELGYDSTLLVNNLEQGIAVDVQLTDLVTFSVPAEGEYDINGDGITDYVLSNKTILPEMPSITDENTIRRNGRVEFTLTPAKGQWFTKVADLSSSSEGNLITTKEATDFSCQVVIDNILENVNLDIATEHYYTITLPTVKNGSISVTDGNGKQIKNGDKVAEGTRLNLEAKAADHYKFKGWTGSGWTAVGNAVKTSIASVSSDVTIGGSFAWETRYYTVSFENTEGGKLVVTDAAGNVITNGAKVEEGIILTLVAEADDHYVFLGFEGDVTDNETTAYLEVEKDVQIKASFGWEDYYYILSVDDVAHGKFKVKDAEGKSYTDGDQVLENTELTVTAVPDKKYLLKSWDMTTGRKKKVKFKMTSDITIGAVFIPDKKSQFTVSNGKYVITKTALDTTGTVECIGTQKMAKNGKLTIPSTVKIQGLTYDVTSIAKKAFYKSSKIKSVKIGKNVKVIGAEAFRNCKNLKTVEIGDDVTDIKSLAFYDCKNLKSLTIGKGVTTFGEHVFCKDRKLSKVVVKTTKLKKIPDHLFWKVGDVTFYVPAKKYKAYKKLFKEQGQFGTVRFKKLK